jgi:hypothetical protein
MSMRIWMSLMLSGALMAVVSTSNAVSQNVLTGEWTASIENKSDKIHLKFEHRTEKNGRSSYGQSYDFSELQGLTREQALGSGAARFSLVREAGRIDCEGTFQNGKGSGTFRFTGDLGFVSAMKSRGFDLEDNTGRSSDHRLFAATTLNVTTALADDLNSAGFGKLDVDDLFKAAIFKVDSRFKREMDAAGFGSLRMEELVKARIFKVDAQFKREMDAAGFGNLGMEELVKARIFKIDSELVSQAKQMGFESESLESLVKLRIFKVTPEFIAEARNEGLTNLSLEDAVKLRIFNIDSAFIRKARADGVPIEVEKLVEKKIGVRHRDQF